MKEKINYTYILECADGSYYTGFTNDLENRLDKHNSKNGAKYTRSRTPVKFIFIKAFSTKQAAMSLEKRIKLLTRRKKEEIIDASNLEFIIKKASK